LKISGRNSPVVFITVDDPNGRDKYKRYANGGGGGGEIVAIAVCPY